MGRGLSELQKAMLGLAWTEKEKHDNAYKDKKLVARWREWDHTNFERYKLPDESKPVVPIEFKPFVEDNWLGAVYFSEILRKVYGWTPKPRNPLCRYIIPDKFSKKEIGEKKYMAAYIAVRKAASRLEKRGLIHVVSNRDYYLTEEGEKTGSLLAKPPEPIAPKPKDEKVELRYLRDIISQQDGKLVHPKGKIIEVDKENAKRMLVAGIWEVVTAAPVPEVKEVKDSNAPVGKPFKKMMRKKRVEVLKYVLAELQAGREPRICDVAAKFETATARYDIWLPLEVNLAGGIIHNTKKGIKAIGDSIG